MTPCPSSHRILRESMAEIKPSILKRDGKEMTKGERARKGSIFSIVDVKTLPKRYPQQSLTWRGKLARKIRIENELARHTLAEFFATFYFMVRMVILKIIECVMFFSTELLNYGVSVFCERFLQCLDRLRDQSDKTLGTAGFMNGT